MGEKDKEGEAARALVRDTFDACAAHLDDADRRRVYVNYQQEMDDDDAAAAYADVAERLSAAKRRYDPDNVFRRDVCRHVRV
mmetsp:Transcript_29698/g.72249  ORF Transcript_29698/g.72249 Transcript_29698/m.72249 type:complete len:82 (-) Transcript_29698:139-384(-)